MPNVNSYVFRGDTWEPVGAPLHQLEPTVGESDQILTVGAISASFSTLAASTTHVMWTVNTAPIRARFTGSAPTATCGHFLDIGDQGVWSATMAACARFIRAASTDATVFITQLR